MIPKTYCLIFAACLGALVSVNAFSVPVFDPAGSATMCNGASIGFESKLRHIAENPSVDVMLFGNSRIIAVGTEEIGLPGVTVFNTGSGGTSFRQSVATLERVIATGKPPKVAVLSFDHVSLLYAQGAVDWPPAPARWPLVAGDALALISAPYRVGPDIRAFSKAVFGAELNHVAKLANVKLLWSRLKVMAGEMAPCQAGYRADGSRPWSKPAKIDLNGSALPVYTPLDARYPLLEHDLDRLAAIQAKGVKVVVYESPLHPRLDEVVEPLLPDEQRRQRVRLRDGALARGLTYHAAPVIWGSERDGFWHDPDHAPARALGRFIAGLVAPLLSPPPRSAS
ncbi:hypothetical protein CCC_00796 [Paramagnetospirillum magnetotacticum MS-1]|uniref:Uncharacterized protein n=1 Tax=Paramagnetospirillum magnetotacticum MS-1 TaxID=272627 RepID=A0A0C2YSN8_PARME|nr:hypothetical protein [Paramagnetospirillum magnetotacticum]KIL97735.1 hypothetical protein CCC_00796 [Paramagnetospirillum magnetotacticum MS-1]